MSSSGQLVAGVAHEDYTQDLLKLLNLYQQRYGRLDSDIQALMFDIELESLIEDLPKTLASMKVGTDRIRQIALSLRNFSWLDESEMKPINLHEGIDSTLLILQNRLKPKPPQSEIQVVKHHGNLPLV